MRIARKFVWSDGRPDDHDEIVSASVDHRVTHEGVSFELHDWDIRYRAGKRRLTEAIYNEFHQRAPVSSAPEAIG